MTAVTWSSARSSQHDQRWGLVVQSTRPGTQIQGASWVLGAGLVSGTHDQACHKLSHSFP